MQIKKHSVNRPKLSKEDTTKFTQKLLQLRDVSLELSPEELATEEAKLQKEWGPKIPTVSLFIRWSKVSKRHFNNDSISLLKTIARQCTMSAVDLLEKVKTYRVCPPSKTDRLKPFFFGCILRK